MGVGTNQKYARLPLAERGNRTVTNVMIQQGGDANVAPWAKPNNTDPIPANKLTNAPAGGGTVDRAAVERIIEDKVDDWAETGNTTSIPADKLVNAAGSGQISLAIAPKEATFGLPTIAVTTLTTTSPNTYVFSDLGQLSGNGVALFLVPSVVSNVGRITFPRDGAVSGLLTASINIVSSSVGGSGSTGHFSVIVNLHSSNGTVKRKFKHTEAINDPVTEQSLDPVSVGIPFTPVDANDYITMQVGFEASRANGNIRFNIPQASTNRREQLDLVFYDGIAVANWARANDNTPIPANKLTNVHLPESDAPATWAEAGNKDPIPSEKLSNLLMKANTVNVLKAFAAGSSAPARVTTLQLPTNFATMYKYLLIGNDGPGEYGIIDLEYLNLLPDATLAITSQANPLRYNWTKATRTIAGQINGAYLYGFTNGRLFREDGWVRSARKESGPPGNTDATNDSFGSIDVTKSTVDQFQYFTSSLFGPGTVQFLPNQFYKDLNINEHRIFRVYDEPNTATLKVTRDSSTGWDFSSHNESTGNDNNQMRDAGFVNFGREELITPANGPTMMTLPSNFKDHDLFIAVTKNDADDYYTMWAIKVKFPFILAHLNNNRVFNPAKKIVYAALVSIESEIEIKAEDVSVDDSSFTNISGDTAQEAFDNVDEVIQTAAKTKDYAKVGNTAKIPFTDYGTAGTVAEIQAIPSNRLIANHLYAGF